MVIYFLISLNITWRPWWIGWVRWPWTIGWVWTIRRDRAVRWKGTVWWVGWKAAASMAKLCTFWLGVWPCPMWTFVSWKVITVWAPCLGLVVSLLKCSSWSSFPISRLNAKTHSTKSNLITSKSNLHYPSYNSPECPDAVVCLGSPRIRDVFLVLW